ncbi:uncharacterized protein LOC136088541 isoform X3 [Hydra vulgaris]|uniref:Uncharacterized protein LOC136088541 isoform X3 n=1 Tax=Hydra vulgaris TaxID=6087 RepID=A0ABM4D2M4_HYDVU
MNNKKRKMEKNLGNKFTCPKCWQLLFDVSTASTNNHIENCYALRCPQCPSIPSFKEVEEFFIHIQNNHGIKKQSLFCPACRISVTNESNLIEHFLKTHFTTKKITCPLCSTITTDETCFVDHLKSKHLKLLKNNCKRCIYNEELIKRLLKDGDRVIALWGQSKWQYFTGKIKRFLKDSLKYEIDWDDGDSTGRFVDYFNIAKDRIPTKEELGTGSIILFAQGTYVVSSDPIMGGKRWHEGIITSVNTLPDGSKTYNGCHTKTAKDGKVVNFQGYSHSFTGLSKYEFRIRPNVYDVIEDSNDLQSEKEPDIFFSYNLLDSFNAFQNRKNNDLTFSGTSFKNYENICDPYEIECFLRKSGYSTAHQVRTGIRDLKSISVSIKNAKVFIACISEAYVNDENCKMEFQFANISLHKPVIPLVIGHSLAWSTSVVGMLIAGKLFIHFKDKENEAQKINELLIAVNSLINLKIEKKLIKEINNYYFDVFLSYCWKNSYRAEELKQIEKSVGNKFADPRLLKDMIAQLGYKVWLDTEQLSPANTSSGLFGQITEGIKLAKVFIPFISDDYSSSTNCRMELQFALKSLNKPVIPIVVGKDIDWKHSVVGALMSTFEGCLINLQDVYNYDSLQRKFEDIRTALELQIYDKERLYFMTTAKELSNKCENNYYTPKILFSRAPKVGDHVLCHHFNMAYYMATVVDFNPSFLIYTVNWDDNDPTGREVMFNEIAIDVPPDPDYIGVGSLIFFPQGSYVGTEGNNIGGKRYHEGKVTSIKRSVSGLLLLSGHHTKSEEDGKWIKYNNYNHSFIDIPITNIRLAPTALEAISVENTGEVLS